MTFLVAAAVLLMLWAGVTALLIGGMWVLLPLLPVAQVTPALWAWHFLRGDNGVCGTLRIAVAVAGIVWWCQTAGVVLSSHIRHSLILLLGIAFLVAMFNAGRRLALSPMEEVLFCAALGGGLGGCVGDGVVLASSSMKGTTNRFASVDYILLTGRERKHGWYSTQSILPWRYRNDS